MRRIFVVFSVVWGLASAQSVEAGKTRIEPPSIADLIEQESAQAFDLSPDGRRAVYVKTFPAKDKRKERSKLWVVDLTTGDARPLTGGPSEDTEPRWSPDGAAVAFLAAREPADPGDDAKGGRPRRGAKESDDQKPQVQLLWMDGGEAVALTEMPQGVATFRWSAPGRIVIAAREQLSRDEARRKKDHDDSVAVEDLKLFRAGAVRLFEVTVGKSEPKVTRLTTNEDQITTFELSPDGKHAVALHQVSPTYEVDQRIPPKVMVWDLAAGTGREVFGDRKSRPTNFSWSTDGARILATGNDPTHDGEDDAGVTHAFEVESGSLAVRPINLDWPRGLTAPELWVTEDGFLARLADGARPKMARFVRAPSGEWTRANLEGADSARVRDLWGRASTDRVVYVASSASDPGAFCSARVDGGKLVDRHELEVRSPPLDGKRLARTEVITFPGANDEPVEALLFFPHSHRDGEKHPLVLMTHGGPYSATLDEFGDRWIYAPNLYAARGAYVLSVNYHGSSDYGRDFAESIRHRTFELELIDLARGIEAVLKREPIDRARLGLTGWSNGAILSIAMLTLRERYAPGFAFDFRCCIAGAGDVNFTSDYGVCEFGVSFDNYYLGGPPWRHAETYLKKSALFDVESVTTPTLVMIGEKDRAVPTNQGWEWYRALEQVGKAPVRFVMFPEEEHILKSLVRRRRKLEEEMAFVDRYLFARPARDALVEGSPLWAASFPPAMVDGDFGVAFRAESQPATARTPLLVPEMVDAGRVRIGRYEVTRAQWKSFRPDLDLAPGTGNYPISGLSFDDAASYCAWLVRTTGRRFRLPTTDELESLIAEAPEGENTLEWWVGSEGSPLDVDSLRDRAREIFAALPENGIPPLLLPAGSRSAAPIGPDGRRRPVFDLGGNVGEWAVVPAESKDAASRPFFEGRVLGGCAYFPADKWRGKVEPPAAYSGVRVAEDPL